MKKHFLYSSNLSFLLGLWGLAFSVILAFIADPSQAQDNEAIRHRFLKEAPPAWEKYRTLAEKLQGSVESITKDDEKTTVHRRFEIKTNVRCRFYLLHAVASGNERVTASNSQYDFTLYRDSSEKSWALETVILKKEEAETRLEPTVSAGVRLLDCLLLAYAVDVAELVGQENFRVTRAIVVPREGSEMVEIEFTNFHPLKEPGKKPCLVQSGSIILDPNQFWCVRAGIVECKYGDADAKVKFENETSSNSGKLPIPKVSTSRAEFKTPEKTVIRTGRVDFALRDVSSFPADGEFYLSAFGLPEPVGITPPSPSRLWLWVTLSAIGALVVALLFRMLKRRYQVPEPVKP